MISFLKQTFNEFSEDNCMRMGAALAYYTVFALPPLFVILVTLLGLYYQFAGGGEEAARESMERQITMIAGEGAREPITEMLSHAHQKGGGWITWIVSVVGVLFGATGLVAALQETLNEAWEVKPDPNQGGIKAFLMKRVFSLGMILGIGFILLVSMLLTTWVSAIFGEEHGILATAVSFLVVTVLFALMFKYVPDAKVRWKDVFVGAVVTALLFTVGKYGLSLYLANADFAAQFGNAAASLAALLVWVYYSSLILLFGAEFTQVWAKRRGGGVHPEEGAVRVVKETRPASPAAG